MSGPFLVFIGIYIISVLAAFFVYLMKYRKKRKRMRRNRAAEAIIKDALLDHSIRNPYKAAFLRVPSSARVFLAVTMKVEGKRQEIIFDPIEGVYFGQGAFNKIRIFDRQVSEKQGCIYYKLGALWLKNLSGSVAVFVDRVSGGSVKVLPKGAVQLFSGDKITVGNSSMVIS